MSDGNQNIKINEYPVSDGNFFFSAKKSIAKAESQCDTIYSHYSKTDKKYKGIKADHKIIIDKVLDTEKSRVYSYLAKVDKLPVNDPLIKYTNYSTYRQLKSGQGQRGGANRRPESSENK